LFIIFASLAKAIEFFDQAAQTSALISEGELNGTIDCPKELETDVLNTICATRVSQLKILQRTV